MTDEGQAVLGHALVRKLVEQNQQQGLDVDEHFELPQSTQILGQAVQVQFDFVWRIQHKQRKLLQQSCLVLPDEFGLKLVEVSDQNLGATLLARLEHNVFEQALVTLTSLPVLFELELLHVVNNAALDDKANLVPEDIGEQASDDANIQEEAHQLAAGQDNRLDRCIVEGQGHKLELDLAAHGVVLAELDEDLLFELSWEEGPQGVLRRREQLLDVSQDVVVLTFAEEHSIEQIGCLTDPLQQSIEAQLRLLVLAL